MTTNTHFVYFMVSITSFKSYWTQHNIHFVHFGPIWSKKGDKAGNVLGISSLVTDK